MVERLNQEIRCRERVIRIFPDEESAMRLIGAVLMEIDSIGGVLGVEGQHGAGKGRSGTQ